jgi:hypothetical protein
VGLNHRPVDGITKELVQVAIVHPSIRAIQGGPLLVANPRHDLYA